MDAGSWMQTLALLLIVIFIIDIHSMIQVILIHLLHQQS